jgi:hypothetical protein
VSPALLARRTYWRRIGKRWTVMQPHLQHAPELGRRFIQRSLKLGWWMHWSRG